MSKVTLHLVDGTYELFRAYFAVPSQVGATGQEVGATRGLIQTLLSLLSRSDVTHVACAFDHVIESFRNQLFAGYKTSEGIPHELFSQFELAERATRALGIVTWPMIDFEADDALATAAARFGGDERVERVVVCSPDKDLLQCVEGTRIVSWDRQRDKLYDEAAVVEKLGVLPRQVPDFLALVGDTADGIPGVPRWGKASAARVLAQCGSLEQIPQTAKELGVSLRGADSLIASLNTLRPEAALYKVLATLRRDVPLAESLEELEYKGSPRAELSAFLVEIGAQTLEARVPRFRD
ncbi:MAG: 5'-3' exonuclease H3TH domain-containing protein [Polyangiaceae bacterium]